MKKKILIFLIVLIVIFLLFIFYYTNKYERIINNTLDKFDTSDYKITLTLNRNYYNSNKKIDSKIKYQEIKSDSKHKYISKLYENNSLIDKNINYDSNKKDFNFNFKEFFVSNNNITKYYKKNGYTYYVLKMKTTNAFSLIYNNSDNSNLSKNTYVIIKCNNNYIESISFSTNSSEEKYKVKINIEFTMQEI